MLKSGNKNRHLRYPTLSGTLTEYPNMDTAKIESFLNNYSRCSIESVNVDQPNIVSQPTLSVSAKPDYLIVPSSNVQSARIERDFILEQVRAHTSAAEFIISASDAAAGTVRSTVQRVASEVERDFTEFLADTKISEPGKVVAEASRLRRKIAREFQLLKTPFVKAKISTASIQEVFGNLEIAENYVKLRPDLSEELKQLGRSLSLESAKSRLVRTVNGKTLVASKFASKLGKLNWVLAVVPIGVAVAAMLKAKTVDQVERARKRFYKEGLTFVVNTIAGAIITTGLAIALAPTAAGVLTVAALGIVTTTAFGFLIGEGIEKFDADLDGILNILP